VRTVHVIQPREAHGTVLGSGARAMCTGGVALSALREIIAADAKDAEREHFVVCVGGEAAQLAAASAGLGRVMPMPCALGDVRRGAAELRRVMGALGRVDMAAAWGSFASDVARKLAGEVVWWEVSVARGEMVRLDAGGRASGDVMTLPWRSAMQRRGATQREARGLLGLPENQKCIGLLADVHADAEATEFMLCVSVLHAAGLRLSAVMPEGLGGAARSREHLRLGTYVREIALTGMSPAGWAAACDVCVIAEGPRFVTGLMVCDAIAAGSGVVLTRASQRELGLEGLEDLAAKSSRATDVARVALRLLDSDEARGDAVWRYREAIARVGGPTLRESWFALARV